MFAIRQLLGTFVANLFRSRRRLEAGPNSSFVLQEPAVRCFLFLSSEFDRLAWPVVRRDTDDTKRAPGDTLAIPESGKCWIG
jgi:hypothetical protein